jgi:hypothetical protein
VGQVEEGVKRAYSGVGDEDVDSGKGGDGRGDDLVWSAGWSAGWLEKRLEDRGPKTEGRQPLRRRSRRLMMVSRRGTLSLSLRHHAGCLAGRDTGRWCNAEDPRITR